MSPKHQSPLQAEHMSDEIGEYLLDSTRKKFYLKDRVRRILIDRDSSSSIFEKNDKTEVKGFSSLTGNHLHALTYVFRNPSFENITKEIQ